MPQKRTIVVVDDEPLVAKATGVAIMSSFSQHEVIVCTSPEQGIQTLSAREVAVLLCDLRMPVYDGTYVLKKAFDANPRTVALLVTGFATKDGLLAALNEGHVWKCIEKPWTADGLCRTVGDALAEYEKRITATETKPAAAKPAGWKPIEIRPAEKKQVREGEKQPKQIIIRKAPPPPPPAATGKKLVFKKVKMQPKGMPSKGPQAKLRQREIPSVLANRYRDLARIEEGGSAAVYRATDSLLNMTVAIKIIAERFVKKAEAMQTLFNEARLAMQLSHRHIVRLHNVQESNGIYFLVMEYIQGATLRAILERNGPFSPSIVLKIVGVCEDALGYAHRRQIYHRDLKPENLMLGEDGILKIIDFGVACLALQDVRGNDEVQGTPYYMSPEEIRGGLIDQRTDVYSLGITVHELLTGNLPPDAAPGNDPFAYIPVPQEGLPEPIRAFLQTSFTREPADRWQDVHEFAGKFREAYTLSFPSTSG